MEEKLAACRSDELSAQAMVYCLFRLVSRVARLHKTIRFAKQAAVSSGRAGVPQDIAVAADMAEDQMGLAKEMLGTHIQPYFKESVLLFGFILLMFRNQRFPCRKEYHLNALMYRIKEGR